MQAHIGRGEVLILLLPISIGSSIFCKLMEVTFCNSFRSIGARTTLQLKLNPVGKVGVRSVRSRESVNSEYLNKLFEIEFLAG